MDLSARRHGAGRRTWIALLALCALTAGVAPVVFAVSTGPLAGAEVSPYVLVSVTGASLGDLTVASPYALDPAFSPATTDYDVPCQSGTNGCEPHAHREWGSGDGGDQPAGDGRPRGHPPPCR